MSLPVSAIPEPRRAVHPHDRLWDIAAAALVLGGVLLFMIGRAALASIAAGTYDLPMGLTFVERADFHSRQATLGVTSVLIGIGLGVLAALRHAHRGSAFAERRL